MRAFGRTVYRGSVECGVRDPFFVTLSFFFMLLLVVVFRSQDAQARTDLFEFCVR